MLVLLWCLHLNSQLGIFIKGRLLTLYSLFLDPKLVVNSSRSWLALSALVPDPYIHFFTLTITNSFKVVTIYHTDWLYVPTFTSLYVVTIPYEYRPLQAHMANTCCPQAFRDRLTRFLLRGRWDEDQVRCWDVLHGSSIIVLQEGIV